MVVEEMLLHHNNQEILVDLVVVMHIINHQVVVYQVIHLLQTPLKEILVELEMEDLVEDLLLDQVVVVEQRLLEEMDVVLWLVELELPIQF